MQSFYNNNAAPPQVNFSAASETVRARRSCYCHTASRNKCVFRSFLNDPRGSWTTVSRNVAGRRFHADGPATEKLHFCAVAP